MKTPIIQLACAGALAGTLASALSIPEMFEIGLADLALSKDPEPVPGNTPVELCDTGSEHLFQFTNVTLDPELPEAGQSLTIYAAGILKAPVVAGAYVDVTAAWGLITLLRQRYDLCENLGEVDLECPVAPGPIEITKVVQMPDTLPPGQYSVSAKAYTEGDDLLSCVKAQVALGF